MSLFEKSEITVAQSGQRTPEEEKKMLGYPSMRPMDFDGTLEAWLLRLTVWGTVAIKQNDPENGVKGRVVSSDYFFR